MTARLVGLPASNPINQNRVPVEMMRTNTIYRIGKPRRRGAMLILVLVMITVLLVFAVFSTDVAYMQLTRTELRTATDAAARAGAEALSRTQSETEARSAAVAAAALNSVAGDPMLLASGDVIFEKEEVDNGLGGTDTVPAVRVVASRTDGSQSGPVTLLLGNILDTNFFQPSFESTAVNMDRDIVMVIDRSGSMNFSIQDNSTPPGTNVCEHPHPTLSRFAALHEAFGVFVAELDKTVQKEQLGLASYSSAGTFCGQPFTDSSIEALLDEDYGPSQSAMDRMFANPVQGATNITSGVNTGIDILIDRSRSREFAKRTMVVLTDGVFNRGGNPISTADRAVREEITIHTITFSDAANQTDMRALANATGGSHFHAPNAAALQDAFKEIASTLPVVLTQ